MSVYSLTTILTTITKKNGSKRLLYNFGPVGGWNSGVMTAIFISLPFIEFAALFNPYSFEYLGIAQSIIFFIVFLSMLMILITGLIFALNANLIRKVTESWDIYFEGRSLTMVTSSGITPYSKFFEEYALLLKENLSEDEMHKSLLKAFETMEIDNKDLLDAMNRNT